MFAKSFILDVFLGSGCALGIFILGNTFSPLFCLWAMQIKKGKGRATTFLGLSNQYLRKILREE